MLSENLIEQTATLFPNFAKADTRVEIIERGGSDRKFYRLRVGEESVLLIKYGGLREENQLYADIARFLASLGIAVPRIFFTTLRKA